MKRFMLQASSVLALSLGSANIAYAQDTQAPETAKSGGVGEIVVTALRKEESLQDVGVPIDAISGDSLLKRGIQVANDLNAAVPAIQISSNGGQSTNIFLRGVGNTTTTSYFDGAVSTSYDGVTLGRPSGAFSSAFFDLARVEVLKGPQGTLYGRNATGGAVNIIPNRPELGALGAGFRVSAGNYSAISAEAYVNVPVGDKTAIRVAAMRQVHDGYNRDRSDDLDRSALRGQLLFEASDNLNIRIGADYSEIGGIGTGVSYIGRFQQGMFIPAPTDNYEGINTPASNAFRTASLGAPGFGPLSAINRQQEIDFTNWGINAEVKLDTAIGEFTFVPGYRNTKGHTFFYGPAFNTALFDEEYTQYSAELRLAGSTGPIDYIVGGFYFDEDITAQNQFNQEFVLPLLDYNTGTKSKAAFAHLTYNISDRLRLIGGLRYTEDKKTMDGLITNFITFCGDAPAPFGTGNLIPPASFGNGCGVPGNLPHYPNLLTQQDTYSWLVANNWIANTGLTDTSQVFQLSNGVGAILKAVNPVNESGKFDKLTWKVGAEFDITEDNLFYASVESGYRAGGFQLAAGNTSYDPETITAFTVGSKNRFLDDRVQLNLEAFYWKYKDQQITYFTVSPQGVLVNANQNVGRSDIKGFEADLIVKPMSSTTLTAKVQYLDTEYKDLTLFTAPPRDNFNCPFNFVSYGDFDRFPATAANPAGTPVVAGGAPVKAFNCSGNPLLFSPKWTMNFGIEQVVALGQDFDLVATANTAYRGKQFGGFEFLDFQNIPASWTSSASLTLREVDGRWSIGAFVNNIEDKRRITQPQSSPIGFAVANYGAPRTYGLRLGADF